MRAYFVSDQRERANGRDTPYLAIWLRPCRFRCSPNTTPSPGARRDRLPVGASVDDAAQSDERQRLAGWSARRLEREVSGLRRQPKPFSTTCARGAHVFVLSAPFVLSVLSRGRQNVLCVASRACVMAGTKPPFKMTPIPIPIWGEHFLASVARTRVSALPPCTAVE